MIGLADEIYQGFVPGRQRDPFDWIADVTAIAVAALVVQLAFPRRTGGAENSAVNPSR
jgi:VanZ family protein